MNEINIKSMLKISFGIFGLFILILAGLGAWQTTQISNHTETLYNHPLVVRRAIDNIYIETNNINIYVRDLIINEEPEKNKSSLASISISEHNIENEISIIHERYLGDKQDITNIEIALKTWENEISRVQRLVEEGKRQEV